jgi:glycosyltransferase involved in cell wall biosynthesis
MRDVASTTNPGGERLCESTRPTLTVFVPAFNEERNIAKALQSVKEASAACGVSVEVLVYDDCSADATCAEVERFRSTEPEMSIRLIRNSRNMGLGHNYVEAAFAGKGEYLMLVNGDADMSASCLETIMRCIGKADIVVPYMGNQDARGLGRRRLSVVFTALINFLNGHKLPYYNGPVVHRRYNVMRWHPDTMGFAYQAELLTRLLGQGATFVTVPYANTERESGVSKALSFKNCLSVGHSILQILLRRMRRAIFGV